MELVKIQQPGKPGFYTFINPDFVTHVTTTVGEGGGAITFHLSNQATPVELRVEATNAANADKLVNEVMKKLFGTIKSIDATQFRGLLGKPASSVTL